MNYRRLRSPKGLAFDKQGLIPCVVFHRTTKTVLMLGYMNAESVRETLRRKKIVFYSRSRKTLWEKGETSGHMMFLEGLFLDCDRDALLAFISGEGPFCHLDHYSCFAETKDGPWTLEALSAVIASRKREKPSGSYVAALLKKGKNAYLKKVIEESGEFLMAASGGNRTDMIEEGADLLFHFLIALEGLGISPEEVMASLGRRAKKARKSRASSKKHRR